jgi:hypothetical protein
MVVVQGPDAARTSYIQTYINIYISFIYYISTYLSYLYVSIYSSITVVDIGRFFSFLNLYTVCSTLWTGDQPSQ